MTQEIFKRYEKKYMLTQKQYDAVMPALERQMDTDHYGEYTISNIYFDTPDFQLVRQSIEKPEYKEKLRLRAYGKATDTSVVYAELKKKFDGVVYKRRIPMPLCQARKYLYYGIRRIEESQILKEIDYVLNQKAVESRDFETIEKEMTTIAEFCRKNKIKDKVIVEMCKLDGDEEAKRKVCEIALKAKPVYLKTSTGRSFKGADLNDVKLMKSILKDAVKIKAAGGIHNYEEAKAFIDAGASALGASAGIAIVEGESK